MGEAGGLGLPDICRSFAGRATADHAPLPLRAATGTATEGARRRHPPRPPARAACRATAAPGAPQPPPPRLLCPGHEPRVLPTRPPPQCSLRWPWVPEQGRGPPAQARPQHSTLVCRVTAQWGEGPLLLFCEPHLKDSGRYMQRHKPPTPRRSP